MPSLGKTVKAETCFEQLHVRGAEGQRQIGRQRRGDAEPSRHIHDGVDADFFREFYRGTLREPARARRRVIVPSNFSS